MPEARKPLPRNGPSYEVAGMRFQIRSASARNRFQAWPDDISSSSTPPGQGAAAGAGAVTAGPATAGLDASAAAAVPATPPSSALREISTMRPPHKSSEHVPPWRAAGVRHHG